MKKLSYEEKVWRRFKRVAREEDVITLDARKLKKYLFWLSESSLYNEKEKLSSGNVIGACVNAECARVAQMLIDKINDGDFSFGN